MDLPTSTRQWVLREKPYGEPVVEGDNSTFAIEETSIPALQDGQVLLKTLYLSNDPTQRSWISPLAQPDRLYLPPVEVGEVMRSIGIAQVVHSRSPDIAAGALVTCFPGWAEYSVKNSSEVYPIDTTVDLPVTHFLGVLGLTGFTAYCALKHVVKAKAEDVIVISGAAGAVGSVAVQMAKKMIGCRKVIGIAGTDAKCRWVEQLGADVCVNYKSPSFKEELTRETEGFVEIYFDNVGGEILDFMLTRMAKFGRVAACGAISDYNRDTDTFGLKNYYEIITMRLQVLGFINLDYIEHLTEARQVLVDEWKKGNLTINEDIEMVVEASFDEIPQTWMMLYSGRNQGKLVTKLKV